MNYKLSTTNYEASTRVEGLSSKKISTSTRVEGPSSKKTMLPRAWKVRPVKKQCFRACEYAVP